MYMLDEQIYREAQLMLDECPNVFVYGTLKGGRGNHGCLSGATFIDEAVTDAKFALGDAGVPYAFPTDVVPPKYHDDLLYPVRGELYRINTQDVAMRLDALEGYPDYYNRRVVDVFTKKDGIALAAWIYTIEDFSYAEWCDAADHNGKEWEWN